MLLEFFLTIFFLGVIFKPSDKSFKRAYIEHMERENNENDVTYMEMIRSKISNRIKGTVNKQNIEDWYFLKIGTAFTKNHRILFIGMFNHWYYVASLSDKIFG